MNDNLIYVKDFDAPIIDRSEVLRYAGVRESSPEAESLLDECIRRAGDVLTYNSCYRFFDIKINGDEIDLGFATVKSRSLSVMLGGCDRIVLFCATVGHKMDRLIAKYTAISPATAVMLQALGSERVEALCDRLCSEVEDIVRGEGCKCTARLSPGYGDLPLDLQRGVFSALDCTRRIGVVLGDSMFMTPSKSVTAIIGIKNVK
ncbi:MAG: hypothetical protein J6V80_07580 [Clostridia bacterium]|nr:hypothetical protein [Clostridia bacterium]